MKRVLFVHRSVGRQVVDAYRSTRDDRGDVGVWDFDANRCETRDLNGESDATAPILISNGDTEPSGLRAFFEYASADAEVASFLRGFDIVAFKSCYSASSIKDDAQLEGFKRSYAEIGKLVRAISHSLVMVIISPPPRRPLLTTAAEVDRAMRFSLWLEELARSDGKAVFFDLHRVLAERGVLRRSYRRWMPFDQHPNDIGAAAGGLAFASAIDRAIDLLETA
jgi:hypothetical protein